MYVLYNMYIYIYTHTVRHPFCTRRYSGALSPARRVHTYIGSSRMWCLRMWCLIIIGVTNNNNNNNNNVSVHNRW